MNVLRDPATKAERKDTMACAAAPYMHPRLAMTATLPPPSSDARVVNLTIVSVPHGAQYNPATGMIVYPDGVECSPPPFVPFTPSPGVDEPPTLPAPVAVDEALEVIEPESDDDKVARLSAWRRRDDTT